MKAFIFDPLWDNLLTPELLAKLEKSGLELIITKDIAPLTSCNALFEGTEERILCLNPDYVGWKLSSDDYKDIPNLRGILTPVTAFFWIDTTYADAHNIPICNIRNYSTQAVAEWAITMMFNVARQVPRLIKDDFPLDFDKDYMKYRGVELHGKTAGIIGLGNIGDAIAQRLEGLGMHVTYWSRTKKDNNYRYKELDTLFRESDVIFPTMAFNEETRKVITTELLETMKPSAIFIGIEHHLFDEEILIDMVKNSKLFGFGFEAAPGAFTNYPGNIWAAPAYAWATDGSMNNSMEKFVENMINATTNNFSTRIN